MRFASQLLVTAKKCRWDSTFLPWHFLRKHTRKAAIFSSTSWRRYWITCSRVGHLVKRRDRVFAHGCAVRLGCNRVLKVYSRLRKPPQREGWLENVGSGDCDGLLSAWHVHEGLMTMGMIAVKESCRAQEPSICQLSFESQHPPRHYSPPSSMVRTERYIEAVKNPWSRRRNTDFLVARTSPNHLHYWSRHRLRAQPSSAPRVSWWRCSARPAPVEPRLCLCGRPIECPCCLNCIGHLLHRTFLSHHDRASPSPRPPRNLPRTIPTPLPSVRLCSAASQLPYPSLFLLSRFLLIHPSCSVHCCFAERALDTLYALPRGIQ
jgi:hypothetical protein